MTPSSLSSQMARRSPLDPPILPGPPSSSSAQHHHPRTPPPSRAPRHYGGYTHTIVSPPAPLRISSSSSQQAAAAPPPPPPPFNPYHLRYERIGPAHLKIFRLSLPPELIHTTYSNDHHQQQHQGLDPIVAHAEQFAKDYLVNGWHTDLYSLTKQDIALRDIPGMARKIQPIFDYVTFAIRTLYGCQKVVVDKNQPHILKYSVESGHTGVELHHDRCDVTANLALSRSDDYCGGGTYFPDTGSIVKLNYGECLLHPGSLVHGGMEVTKGTRYLMVTFAHLR